VFKDEYLFNLANRRNNRMVELNRIIINHTTFDEAELTISASLEVILYRPITGAPVVENYGNIDDPVNRIKFNIKNPDAIDSWTLYADLKNVNKIYYDLVGERAEIKSGKGIPSDIDWNWKVKGGLVTPDIDVPLILSVKTKSGRMLEFESKPIRLEMGSVSRIVRELILVEYIFDEASPTSTYLEGRIYSLARNILNNQGKATDVLITGHTDNIGTDRRNKELSTRRAEREYRRLRTA
jgi:flagellar motor protein MotB